MRVLFLVDMSSISYQYTFPLIQQIESQLEEKMTTTLKRFSDASLYLNTKQRQ